jgi:hypothetical protein
LARNPRKIALWSDEWDLQRRFVPNDLVGEETFLPRWVGREKKALVAIIFQNVVTYVFAGVLVKNGHFMVVFWR